MKWNQVIRPNCDSDPSLDSDEEIQELKQRIRIRRRERMKEVSVVAVAGADDNMAQWCH